MSKKRLGRGLDALLSQSRIETQIGQQNAADQTEGAPPTEPVGAVVNIGGEIGVDEVQPSPYQPRRHFEPEALQELAVSIAQKGLLQPVVVRERPRGGYELIAGERRWRAARLAGLQTIPAVIRTVSDEEASALALVENMQREDLNTMEEAMGLARLRDEFELTQQQIADAVGKSRVAIANLLRLMNLGSLSRDLLQRGLLDMGHARALLGLEGVEQDQAAQQVADQGLSVRQTESLVRNLLKGADAKAVKPGAKKRKDPDTLRLEKRITETIGAPVSIRHSPQGKGELTIRYSNLDELDGVLKHLGVDE